MAILKYTTSIAADKTIAEIHAKLARAGVQAVLCEYESGVPVALSFRVVTDNATVSYRLPARTDGVLVRIRRDPSVPRKLKTPEQAARVAWRILLAWIEAQLALCEAEMSTTAEVFLPYAQVSGGKTVYEAMSDGGFKAIAGP